MPHCGRGKKPINDNAQRKVVNPLKLLSQVHYEKYNSRFGKDGIHEPLDWTSVADEVERFKQDYVIGDIVREEKQEQSMLKWMECLPIHTFEPRHFESSASEKGPLKKAEMLLGKKAEAEEGEAEKEEASS